MWHVHVTLLVIYLCEHTTSHNHYSNIDEQELSI